MKSAKLMSITAMAVFALLAIPVGLVAQGQPSGGPSAAQQDENTVRIPDGTVVRLLVADSVSGKTAKINDPVQLRVIDEVRLGDLVLIANKAPALATISEVRHARRRHGAGEMTIKFDQITLVNDQTQKLRGVAGTKGVPPEGFQGPGDELAGLYVFYLPFLVLGHGNEAILRKGAVLTAAIDGDAILDKASVEAHQPPPSPTKEGPASITIYWPDQERHERGGFWCGTVKLGKLATGHNLTMRLPAGSYWFSFFDKKETVSLTVESGGEYFVRVNPFVVGSSHVGQFLSVVEQDVGEAEASETRPLEAGKYQSTDSASPSDLRANPRSKK